MKTNRPTNWWTVIVLFSCWLALADHGTSADDKVDAKGKIKKLQQERLKEANEARKYLFGQITSGSMPPGATSLTFYLQLAEVSRLAFQAELDLCETKRERRKAIEKTINEFKPIVDKIKRQSKSGVAFHLVRVHLLELEIALEKAKQETGRQ
jgi:hypothetical protein